MTAAVWHVQVLCNAIPDSPRRYLEAKYRTPYTCSTKTRASRSSSMGFNSWRFASSVVPFRVSRNYRKAQRCFTSTVYRAALSTLSTIPAKAEGQGPVSKPGIGVCWQHCLFSIRWPSTCQVMLFSLAGTKCLIASRKNTPQYRYHQRNSISLARNKQVAGCWG